MSKDDLGASHTNPAPLEPEWLRVDASVKFCSLSRSLLYENFDTSGGPIKTAVIRKRGALRGVRLVSVDSLRKFIKSHAVSSDSDNTENEGSQK